MTRFSSVERRKISAVSVVWVFFKKAAVDLSRTRVCYSMTYSKIETARALLGLKVEVSLVLRALPLLLLTGYDWQGFFSATQRLAYSSEAGQSTEASKFKRFACDLSG
jgi:hypothetical protein